MKTKSGFEFAVDPRILTDWRFTTAVSKVQSGTDMEKLASTTDMVMLLLGKEQHDKLMDHIAKKNEGFVPAEEVMKEVTDILSKCGEAKN